MSDNTPTTAPRKPRGGKSGSRSPRPGNPHRNKNATSGRQKAQAGLAARRIALDSLERILDRGQLLDAEFDSAAKDTAYARATPIDRALIRAIVTLTLRRLGQIDDALARLIDKPLPKKARRVRHVLRIAAAQILFMDVADHAAVDLAVALTAGDGRIAGWKGLVNGVCRNLVRQRTDILDTQDAERLNTPDWLWSRWIATYGEQAARRFAAMHAQEPTLDLTVKADPEHWARELDGHVVATGSVRLVPKGPIDRMPGFTQGAWWVQDAAAALPSRLLGDVAGKTVADLCAAPGGKTAELAHAGAEVTAVDISNERLSRVRANLKRLRLSARIVRADLLDWEPEAPFDAILLDAPCSATGTIRRHPDVTRLKSVEDIAALADLQARLVRRAIGWLKPGGRLVYCTCSLEPEEGEAQIAALLADDPRVERVPITAEELSGLADCVTPQGDMRCLPHHLAADDPRLGGMDGFFAARLSRL